MFSPIVTMFLHFPLRAYATILAMLAIGLYSFAYLQHRCEAGSLSKKRGAVIWLLVAYALLLLFFTVLGRRSLDYYRYNFNVGYSYRDAFCNGTPDTVRLIIANIAVFVPVGFLGALGANRHRFSKGLLIGFMLTLSIELLQLVLRNGTCEIDDLISNMIGTLCGSLIVVLFRSRRNPPEPLPPAPAEEDPNVVTYTIERIS